MEYECVIADHELKQIQEKINNRRCSMCIPQNLQIYHFEFTDKGLICGCKVLFSLKELDEHLCKIIKCLRAYYLIIKTILRDCQYVSPDCGLLIYSYL